jgi:hypothetical protein
MKVRMRTTYASERGQAGPGQIIELSPGEVHQLVTGGYADLLPGDTLPEAGPITPLAATGADATAQGATASGAAPRPASPKTQPPRGRRRESK